MKKAIIISSIVAFTVIVIVILNFLYQGGFFERREVVTTTTALNETINKKTTEEEITVVEIKGAVKNPGIYTFYYSPVRIADVIEMAGGLTQLANTDDLNLASIVSNNSSITISSLDQSSSYTPGGSSQEEAVSTNTSTKVNINTATLNELMTLKGIGEKRAQNIIDHRKAYGFFLTIEDVKDVEGIGETVFEAIKDSITV
ncbi:MAG: ComEA family DNA-binding protein [Gammaproteobacteria bacterium]|nr:ComEA family DNA-binding protein [Gammaproteobacteria bacterium]